MGRVQPDPRVPRVPRSRLALHRRALLDPAVLRSWVLLAAGALVVAAAVGHIVSEAQAATHRWGTTRPVLVATRPLRAGGLLAGATRIVRWPVALVPDHAPTRLPARARAAGPMGAGSPITDASVRSSNDDPTDVAPAGQVRVAVPVGPGHLRVRPGDRVDVWATFDPSLTAGSATTRRVASGAEVRWSSDRSVELAVAAERAPEVARAAVLATITLTSSA